MALSPERYAEMVAKIRKPREPKAQEPKPEPVVKVVAEGGRIVRDVAVRVSPADRNYEPRSGGFVRINYAEAERQRLWAEQDRAEWKRRQCELDPFNYGHWGQLED